MNLDRLLVKAKRVDNGEWVEGHYVYRTCWDEKQEVKKGMHQIHVDPQEVGNIYLFEIDPETICQCTGLKDKDGAMIFEGDILKCTDSDLFHGDIDATGEVQFTYCSWWVVTSQDNGNYLDTLVSNDDECEVIGNIHDSKGE